jgi:AcrR family transcriptional regulator
LLEEVGYNRLTIEGVAVRAGVGKTTVYRWWPSKRDLAIEAVGNQLNTAAPKRTGESRGDLRTAIQATLDSYLRLPLGDTVPALAVDLLRDPDGAAAIQTFLQPREDSIRVIIEDAADRGDLPADVDAHLLHDIYAGTLLYRLLVSRRPTDGVVEKLVDLFFDREIPRRVPGAPI